MQRAFPGQTLDRHHRTADGRREGEARENAFAVNEHRTRAALPLITTLLRPGQVKMFTQHIKE